MSRYQTVLLLGIAVLCWPITARAENDLVFALRAVSTPTDNETVTTLPDSIGSVLAADTYHVELWVSDLGTMNTGVTSGYVDLLFDDDLADVLSIDHGTIFVTFAQGTVGAGVVDELGGSTLSGGVGVEPDWVRVATVKVQATALGSSGFSLSSSTTGCAAYGRGLIDWADIGLGSVTVIHATDCNGNGVPDPQDVIGGTSPDCNETGHPDECEVAQGSSTDYNRNMIPDECEGHVPIPTVSTWGLILMTAVFLTAATVVLHRRRAVPATVTRR